MTVVELSCAMPLVIHEVAHVYIAIPVPQTAWSCFLVLLKVAFIYVLVDTSKDSPPFLLCLSN